jgi:APA family basic amino acid/polyamine antiporter
MMGLGSIIGTGVFVSIGIAVDVAGAGVLLAILLSVVVATCNALSSAELAASHPVSGGTYEYGYKYVSPALGFTAGWMFLCAKTASAATAALGFAGYVTTTFGLRDGLLIPIAVATAAVLTGIVLTGLRQSSRVNLVIVVVTLTALVAFCIAGAGVVWESAARVMSSSFQAGESTVGWGAASLFHAAALMFVAFTGYSRIATLGEEVREPERAIPRAIAVTLTISALLYLGVAAVLVCLPGAFPAMSAGGAAAPLETAARQLGAPGVALLVGIGAMTAMLGVLLNLILGLSRVLLAMGRRGDAPSRTAVLNASQTTPYVAVMVVGLAVAGLALIGSVKTTWSFSAFTVLIYYAITNLAALRMPREERRYRPAIAWGGLAGCLFLAFQVEWRVWLTGLALIAVGLAWHLIALRRGHGQPGSHRRCAD